MAQDSLTQQLIQSSLPVERSKTILAQQVKVLIHPLSRVKTRIDKKTQQSLRILTQLFVSVKNHPHLS
jgi:hypothetical protein